MYLKVIIVDENDEVLELAVISQDGSDSEGASKIIEYVAENFTLSDDELILEDEEEGDLDWTAGPLDEEDE